jgi:hypothetical protein
MWIWNLFSDGESRLLMSQCVHDELGPRMLDHDIVLTLDMDSYVVLAMRADAVSTVEGILTAQSRAQISLQATDASRAS